MHICTDVCVRIASVDVCTWHMHVCVCVRPCVHMRHVCMYACLETHDICELLWRQVALYYIEILNRQG